MHSVPLSNRESISNFIRNAETLLAEAKYLASSVLKRARIASQLFECWHYRRGGEHGQACHTWGISFRMLVWDHISHSRHQQMPLMLICNLNRIDRYQVLTRLVHSLHKTGVNILTLRTTIYMTGTKLTNTIVHSI